MRRLKRLPASRSRAGTAKSRKHEPATPPIIAQLRQRSRERLRRRLGWEKIPLKFVKTPLPETVTERYERGHLVAVVRITDEIMNATEEWAAKIQRIDSETGFKESFARRDIAWERAGVLGHLAAAEYLFGDWRKAVKSIEAGVDAADFVFKGQRFDVKTARLETHKMLLVPVAKFQKRRHHVYIGAQLKGPREVWIWGYATREEVASAPVENFGQALAHYIPLRRLHRMDDLAGAEPSLLRFMTCICQGMRLAKITQRYTLVFPAKRRRTYGRRGSRPKTTRGRRVTR